MSEFGNGVGSTRADQERTSFDEQWTRRNATPDSPFDNNHQRGAGHAGPTVWNWVMIAAIAASLAWYIAKLPETIGVR